MCQTQGLQRPVFFNIILPTLVFGVFDIIIDIIPVSLDLHPNVVRQ